MTSFYETIGITTAVGVLVLWAFIFKYLPSVLKHNTKNSKLGNIFVSVLILGVPVVLFWIAYPNWLDVPTLATGNYPEVSGKIENVENVYKKGHTLSGHRITVNKTEYYRQNSSDDTWVKGDYVKMDVLPHTKTVVRFR